MIYQKVHKEGGKVVASGMGKAGQIAENIVTTLSSTETPAVFLHPSEAQHVDLGVIRENDILIVLSNSGKTREIIELVSHMLITLNGITADTWDRNQEVKLNNANLYKYPL